MPLTATTDFNHTASLSPDGARVTFRRTPPGRERFDLMIADVPGGIPKVVSVPDAVPWGWGGNLSLALWVSGTTVALPAGLDNRHYVLHDLGSGTDRELVLPESLGIQPPPVGLGYYLGSAVRYPPFSPAGDQLAALGTEGERGAIFRLSTRTLEPALMTSLPAPRRHAAARDRGAGRMLDAAAGNLG